MAFDPIPASLRASDPSPARLVPVVCGAVALAAGLIGILAPLLELQRVVGEGTSWGAMTPATSLIVVILGLGLLGEANGATRLRWTLRGLAGALLVWCTLIGLGGWRAPLVSVSTPPVMGVFAAALAAGWLVGMRRRAAQVLFGGVGLVGVVVLARAAIGLGPMHSVLRFGELQLSSVVAIALIATGGLFIESTSPMRRLLAGRDTGNLVLRRMLVPALVVPGIVAFVVRQGVADRRWTAIEGARIGAIAGWVLMVGVCAWAAHGAFRQQRRRTLAAARFEVDPLTGAGNRFALERVFARLFYDRDRIPTRGALLSIDVDDFRPLARRVGADEADEILRAIAVCIRHAIRPGDVLVRTGSDEFAIWVSDIDPIDATVVGRNVLHALAELRVTRPELPTVSIGIAALEHDVDEARDLVGRAAYALQQAKDGGKALAILYRAPVKIPEFTPSTIVHLPDDVRPVR